MSIWKAAGIAAIAGAVLILGYILFSPQGPLSQPSSLTPKPQIEKVLPTAFDQKADYKAGFAIFTNGTFREFSAPMYHNRSENVFITVQNPNIVRVKKRGITWDDFFKTLPLKLTSNCLTTGTKQTFCTNGKGVLRFFLNGKETPEMLILPINDGGRALITYGNLTDEEIQRQITRIPQP